MTLQERTLRQYMDLRRNPTLKAIADETGIELTRIFRIMNGTKMRLDEWEIFHSIIVESDNELEKLTRDCLRELSIEQLGEVRAVMQKKLSWSRAVDQAFHSKEMA